MRIRIANFDEFKEFAALANDEFEWELCYEDFLVCKRFLSEETFLVSEEDDGKLTGFIIAVKWHQENFGQIGMFYVKPELRGRRIGASLFRKAMENLKECNVSLMTESALVPKYRDREGFRITPDWRILITDGFPIKFDSFKKSVNNCTNLKNVSVVPITDDRFLKSIIDYDRSIMKLDRSEWCRYFLITHPTAISFLAIDTKNQLSIGYGSIRLIRQGVLKLEPLFADSESIARLLLVKLLSSFDKIDERRIAVFHRSNDEKMQPILQDLGLESLFSAQFMFTEREIDCNYDKIYGLSNFQFSIGY